MTSLNIPHTFVAGTKAKASEVNANFTAVKNAVNSSASKNGDSTEVFSVATATDSNHAVNKGSFDTLETSLNRLVNSNGINFCVRSGYVNSSGEPAILSYSNSTLSFNVDDGTTYKPLVGVTADGTTFTRTSLNSYDSSNLTEDGVYNVFCGSTGNVAVYSDKIHRQYSVPSITIPQSWTQPILTSNGTIGTSDFAVASNSVISGYGEAYYAFANPSQNVAFTKGSGNYLQWYSNTAINISSLTITNPSASDYASISGSDIYASNTNDLSSATLLTSFTNSNTTLNATWTINIPTYSTYYKYYWINNISASGTIGGGVNKIAITATYEQTALNDIWLQTSSNPFKAYMCDGTDWETEFTKVPIGTMTVSNGVITAVNTFDYNDNGVNIRNTANNRARVNAWNMPDLSNSVSLATATNHTITSNGWIGIVGTNGQNSSLTVKIDGAVVQYFANTNNYAQNTYSSFVPVAIGQVVNVTYSNIADGITVKFYPAQGES